MPGSVALALVDVPPPRDADVAVYELVPSTVLPMVPVERYLLLQWREGADATTLAGADVFTPITERVAADTAPEPPAGGLLVNFLNSLPGEEEAVNAWFREEHLPDLLALDGIHAGRRFGAAPGARLGYAFLNLWEVEPTAALRSIEGQRQARRAALARGEPPAVTVHPALIADQRMGGFYRPVTER